MKAPLRAIAFVAIPLLLAAPAPADSEVGKQFVEEILTSDSPESVATTRWVCMKGGEPWVNEGIDDVDGKSGIDTVRCCVAALIRTARDHHLPDLYEELLKRSHLRTEGYENLPLLIGNAALAHEREADAGEGRKVHLEAGLAFDAGFTVAYQTALPEPQGIDEDRLDSIARLCLGEGPPADSNACYLVGTVYGARAARADAPSSASPSPPSS